MRRRLTNVLCCACLLLGGSAAALGVRSHQTGALWAWERLAFVPDRCGGDWEAYRRIALSSYGGGLQVDARWGDPPAWPTPASVAAPEPRAAFRRESFDVDDGAEGDGWSITLRPSQGMPWEAHCPAWAVALGFGLLPGWRALRWYRRRGRAGGPAFEVVTRAVGEPVSRRRGAPIGRTTVAGWRPQTVDDPPRDWARRKARHRTRS